MASNKLDYMITITKGDLSGLQSILSELEALRAIARQGAEFEVRLSAPSVEGIKQQIAEAVGSGISIPRTGGGTPGVASSSTISDPQVVAKLDTLITKIEAVAQAFERAAQGSNTPPAGGAPGGLGGANNATTVKDAARSFANTARAEMEKFSFGPNVKFADKGNDVRDLERNQRKGQSSRTSDMDDAASEAQRIQSIIKNRAEIVKMLTRYDQDLERVAADAQEGYQATANKIRQRLRSLARSGEEYLKAEYDPETGRMKGAGSKPFTRVGDIDDWAKQVRGILESELVSLLDVMSSKGTGMTNVRRRPGDRSGDAGYGNVALDAVALSNTLVRAFEEAAPRIGSAIGSAVATVLQQAPRTAGGAVPGGTVGGGRDPQEARTSPWDYANTLTSRDQARVLSSMQGDQLAAARKAQRQAEITLEQSEKAYNARYAPLIARQEDNEAAIAGRKQQIRELSATKASLTNKDAISATEEAIRNAQSELTRLELEATNIRQAFSQLQNSEGLRRNYATMAVERARAATRAAEAGPASGAMGFGSAADRRAVEDEPDSSLAKKMRQIDNYLATTAGYAVTPSAGVIVRNAMIGVAGQGMVPLAPEALQRGGFFNDDTGLATLIRQRDAQSGVRSKLAADIAGLKLFGPDQGSAEAIAKAQAELVEADKALNEVTRNIRQYMVERIQQAANATIMKVRTLSPNLLKPDGTAAEQDALESTLREAQVKQDFFLQDPRQTDLTRVTAVLQRKAFEVIQPILKQVRAQVEGSDAKISEADLEKLIAPVRGLPLIDAFLPKAGAFDFTRTGVIEGLTNAGRTINPAYNLANVEAPPLKGSLALPITENKIPISPITLSQMRGTEREQYQTVWDDMFASNPYLAFAPQTPERRKAMAAYLNQIERMQNSIMAGELPSYVPLGDPKASMTVPMPGSNLTTTASSPIDLKAMIGQFLSVDPDALDPRLIAQMETMSRTLPKVKINPEGYRDTLQELETKKELAMREQLAYGVVYDRRDPYYVDKIDPITGNRITTGAYRGQQGVGQGIGNNTAVTGPDGIDQSLTQNAMMASFDAMNVATSTMLKNLRDLTGVADPLVKALEPLRDIAKTIESSMAKVGQTLRDLGLTNGSGSTRGGLSAIMTAQARKDIRVQQQRELNQLKDERAAEKALELAFETAGRKDNAFQRQRLLLDAKATEYAALLQQDPTQFMDVFRRTISGSKNQRFNDDKLAYNLTTVAPGTKEELRTLQALQRSEDRGLVANQMLAQAGLTARNFRPYEGAPGTDPFQLLKRNLDQLIPASNAFDVMATTQQGIEAGTKVTNESERRLASFQKLRAQLAEEERKVAELAKARDDKMTLEAQRSALGASIQNMVGTSRLPRQQEMEASLQGKNAVEAAQYLAELTYQQQFAGLPAGKKQTMDQYKRTILRRIVPDPDSIRYEPLRDAAGDPVKDSTGKVMMDYSGAPVDLQAAYKFVADTNRTKGERIATQKAELRGIERQIVDANTILAKFADPNVVNDSPTKALERLRGSASAIEQALFKEGGVSDRGALDTGNERLKTQYETQKAKLDELKKQLAKTMEDAQKALNMPNASRDDMQKRVGELTEAYRKLVPEAIKAADAIAGTIREANKEAAQGGPVGRLVDRFKSLAQFATAGGLLYSVIGQGRRAIDTAIDAEYEARRIQGTLGTKSEGESQDILTNAFASASATGSDVRKALDLSRIFAQTGEDAPKVAEMTRAALMGQVGAGLEGGQAAEFLIAVENISKGQIASSDIIDRISRIESQYAVSARDLSVAIQRAGSLAQQLQPQANGAVSALDLVIGAATSVIERTRVSGEQASTSLRFIFSRLLQPDVGRALQTQFGIKLGGAEPGSLRPLQDILQDISTRYKALNAEGRTAEASQLLVTFAGARQANAAAALLDDFAKSIQVAKESADAYGDTQQRVALQLDTITGQFQRFQTGMAALASNILTNSSIGWAGKNIIGGAATAAEFLSQDGARSTAGLVGTAAVGAGGAFLGSMGLRGIGSYLGSAAPWLTKAGTTGAARAAVTGAAGSSLAGTAVAAGAAASLLEVAVIAALAVAVVGLITAAVKKAVDVFTDDEDEKTIPRFDPKTFRESEFYKSYEQQVGRLGRSPEGATNTIAGVAASVQKQLRDEFGKAADDPKAVEGARIRERAERLFVEGLLEAIPAFRQVGAGLSERAQFQEQLQVASSLLTTGIKYVNAPISDALVNFRADLTNGLNDALKGLSSTTKTMEAEFAQGRQPGGRFANPEQRLTAALSQLGATFKPFGGAVSGEVLANAPFMTATGTTRSLRNTVEYMAPTTPWRDVLRSVNQTVSDNLLVPTSGKYTEQLQQAAANMTAAGRNPSQADILSEAVREYAEGLREGSKSVKLSAEANKSLAKVTEEMTDVARRVFNQQQIVQAILPGLRRQFDPEGRAASGVMDADENLGYSDGEVAIARAYKQALQQGYRTLEAEFQRTVDNEDKPAEERSRAQKALDNLRGLRENLGRQQDSQMMAMVDRQAGLRTARERLLEPYISYGQNLGEIRSMTELRDQYGVDYDPRRAEYDAALRFRQNLGQTSPRIIGDMVRATFPRFLLGGADAASYDNAAGQVQQVLGELGPERTGENIAAYQKTLGSAEAMKIQRQYQASFEALQAQLVLSQKGLGSLVDTLEFSGDAKNGKEAQNLLTSMTELGKQFKDFNPDAKGAAGTFAQLVAAFKELELRAKSLSGDVIKRFVASLDEAAEAQRRIQRVQAQGELRTGAVQFDNEMSLQRRRALGARSVDLLPEQLQAQQRLTATQIQAYDASFAEQVAEIDRQLAEQGADPEKSGALQRRRQDLFNQRNIFMDRTVQGDRQAQNRLVNQEETQILTQQTQQITALVEAAFIAPLKSFLMSYRNFSEDGAKGLLEAMGAAVQEALVNQFMERLQFLVQNPIVDAFRSGGLYSKEYILEAFREGATYVKAATIPSAPTRATTSATTPTTETAVVTPTMADAASVIPAKFRAGASKTAGGLHLREASIMPYLELQPSLSDPQTGGGDVRLSDGTVIPASVFSRMDQLRKAGVWNAAEQAADEFAKSPMYGRSNSTLAPVVTVADALPNRTFDIANTASVLPVGPGAITGTLATSGPALAKQRWWNKEISFGKGKWGQFGNAAANLAGSLGGAAIGNALSPNKGNNFAQEGASIGTMLGSMTPLGPLGGVIGGIAGGWLGGLLGKDKKEDVQTDALQKIERNTREAVQAFENQTQLLQLDSRFLNVPTAFAVPAYRPGLVGSMAAGSTTTVNNSVSVSVTASANMNTQDLANEVAAAIRQELGRAGNSFDIRTM